MIWRKKWFKNFKQIKSMLFLSKFVNDLEVQVTKCRLKQE